MPGTADSINTEHNVWREWTEKYARRIKKIQENPNPHMAKSNILLYEMMYDQARQELEAWESGSQVPIVYYTENAPGRLFKAMGFRVYNIEMFADHLTREQAQRYLELADSLGFPDNACDRVRATAGLALSGHLPPPDLAIAPMADCATMKDALLIAARHWKVPTFGLDMPYQMEMGPAEYLEAMEYVKAQLLEVIDFCEGRWPEHIKYDPQQLEEYQTLYREFTGAQSQVLELLKVKPCPISGRDALRMPPTQVFDDPRVPEYMIQFRDEFQEKAARGEGAVKDNLERLRVYWMCSAPFYEDPFGFLEERGCAIPLYEEGPGVPCRYNVRDFAEAERRFGRRMREPLEEEAAAFTTSHWGAVGERRISEVLRRSQEIGIEGIIHFMQPGCLVCNNIAKVLGERAQKELGIKNLYIEGWAQDMEKHNEAEFEARLEDWLKMCLAEKEAEANPQRTS